jgi:hypothetical protein
MTSHVHALPNGQAIQTYLANPDDAFSTVLVMLVIQRYGRVAVWGDEEHEAWSPGTRRMELEQDFGKITSGIQNLLEAGVAICTTNYFYKDLRRFIMLANTLCGDGPDSLDDPPDSAEVLWALTEAALLWPPDQDPHDTEFSPDIRRLIGETLHEEGITKPFDLLRLGYRPNASVGMVDDMFSDDPDMATALNQGQDARNEELRGMVQDNLRRIHQQLHKLFGRDLGPQLQTVDQRLQQLYAAMQRG